MVSYCLSCPLCGAEPDEAQLAVVKGRFEFSDTGALLSEHGPVLNLSLDDVSDVQVVCNACGEEIPLGDLEEPSDEDEVYHQEIVTIRNLREEPALLKATMDLIDVPMEVIWMRIDKALPQAIETLACLTRLTGRGSFETMQLDNREGEWIMILVPLCEA